MSTTHFKARNVKSIKLDEFFGTEAEASQLDASATSTKKKTKLNKEEKESDPSTNNTAIKVESTTENRKKASELEPFRTDLRMDNITDQKEGDFQQVYVNSTV